MIQIVIISNTYKYQITEKIRDDQRKYLQQCKFGTMACEYAIPKENVLDFLEECMYSTLKIEDRKIFKSILKEKTSNEIDNLLNYNKYKDASIFHKAIKRTGHELWLKDCMKSFTMRKNGIDIYIGNYKSRTLMSLDFSNNNINDSRKENEINRNYKNELDRLFV